MDIYVKLAQETVRDYLERNQLPVIKNQPKILLLKKAGCFVSIHTQDKNELCGCIGTILPVHKNLASEIIANALEAAFHDPRFEPITKDKLDNLKYSVDVLGEIEAIGDKKGLNPQKYGVIVRSKDLMRTGLLLPNLEGVEDVDGQMAIAYKKAGILPEEEVLLYRFTSERHE